MARSIDATFFAGIMCVNVRMFEGGEEVWEGAQRRVADGRSL
jgi:hypothetical protein